MKAFITLLKNFVHGQLSMRQFLILFVSGAILWLVGTAFGGIVEVEASNFWTDLQPFLQTPVPMWVTCSTLPLALVLFFSIGVAMSRKFQSPGQTSPLNTDGISNSDNESLEMETDESFLDESLESPISSSTGELLAERTRVADGEISDGEFASHVLYWLNRQKISEKVAKRLLTGLRYEIQVMSEGKYTLVEKI